MYPVDPGEHWLAAGITGLSRQREWDAVVTVSAPGTDGEDAGFIVLEGGRVLVEDAPEGFDPGPLAAALGAVLGPPYRARAVRRPELWTVGASSIEVVRLDPDPAGSELELAFDGDDVTLRMDGVPVGPAAAQSLRTLAESRQAGAFVANAHRLADDLWEIQILPL